MVLCTKREETCLSRDYMHCIACTRSFDMGLASAEGQQLERFKGSTYDILMSTMKIRKPIK